MGGIKDIPYVFVSGKGAALSPIVEKGEGDPQQGADAIEEEHAQTEPLGEIQVQQPPAAGGEEEKPEQSLFPCCPMVGEVKRQNKQDVPPAALEKGKMPGEDDRQGRQNVSEIWPSLVSTVHEPQGEKPHQQGKDGEMSGNHSVKTIAVG